MFWIHFMYLFGKDKVFVKIRPFPKKTKTNMEGDWTNLLSIISK